MSHRNSAQIPVHLVEASASQPRLTGKRQRQPLGRSSNYLPTEYSVLIGAIFVGRVHSNQFNRGTISSVLRSYLITENGVLDNKLN
jgi:hypothetical protein